jgi:hypothetical protein
VSGSLASVSTSCCQLNRTGRAEVGSGTVRVAVRAFAVPENQAVRPSRGRTARDSASPWAAATRAGLTDPHDREGWTRLVSKITKERDAKSITSDVPV